MRILLMALLLIFIPHAPAHASYAPASVMDYCTAGSLSHTYGGADNTTCVQAAINNICNRSPAGGTLYFPPGLYQVQYLTVPCAGVTLQGEGWGGRDYPNQQGTFIVGLLTFTGKPIIQFNVTSPVPSPHSLGGEVSRMWIVSNYGGGTRSDPYIEFDHVQGGLVDDVSFFAPCTAVKIFAGFRNHVTNSESVQQPISNCEVMQFVGNDTGVSSTTNASDVAIFDNVKMDAGSGSTCFGQHGYAHTLWISRVVCETSGKALVADCVGVTNQLDCPGFDTLYDFEVEAHGTLGGNLIDIKDMVDGFKITDSWLRGGDVPYVMNNLISISTSRFTTTNLPITIANNWVKFAGSDCLDVSGGNVTITGNTIYGCSFYSSGVASGVKVSGKRTAVTGNTFCGDDLVGNITWTMKGITVPAGVDYVTATGNIFSASVGSNVNACIAGFTGSGTHVASTGNVGP